MPAKPPSGPLADAPADVQVSAPDVLAKGFRPYERFHFTLAGRAGPPQVRDILRVGPVAAVLPIDLARDEVVLLRQFRLAAHLVTGKGHMVEIVAGHVEANEKPIDAARRECVEEIGVAPHPLIELFSYLATPGAADEQITLFLGIVDASQVPARAGAAAEREETVTARVPVDAAIAALAEGNLHYAPLIIALQWLALNRGRLGEIVRAGAPIP